MSIQDPLHEAIERLQPFRRSLGDAAIDAAEEALRRVAGAAGDPSRSQRLRQVSILFADVADSTAMLERVGAADAMDLLGRALQSFAEAVQAFGGQVLRFTGDGLKAAFGMQGSREDDAERAVRAGLRILEEARAHADWLERELALRGFGVRVGVHTGPVLLGGGVEADRSAMGHAVHLAARMEQSAPVGRLRISDDTWQQVRGLFQAEAQPPLTVKGHSEPLKTWLVSRALEGPELEVQRGLEGVATPMLGREAELAALCALPERVRQTSRPQAVLVVGDAGVGKTRLRREMLAALGLADGSAGLLQARAHPSTLLQPFGLLRQLLLRWCRIGDDGASEVARQRLADVLSPWLGADAAQQVPRIGQIVGFDFSDHPAVTALTPALLREQAFAALQSALEASARAAPTLLVLDDLHWADDDSLEFVQRLLRTATAPLAPLAMVLLARPALDERRLDWVPGGGSVLQRLDLAPLAADGSAALLDALLAPLPELPQMLRAELLERAAGNPFFLEALVRMLVDDGVIVTDRQPWALQAERLAAWRVPTTLVAVLEASLDALPTGEREALQAASIIGPVFWDAALEALDAEALGALPGLLRRQFLLARHTSTFADSAERAFRHQLLHETTYQTVLKPQRRAGHVRAARWLAARLHGREAELLAITAEHYERAGESEPALDCWDRAYEDADQRGAHAAALRFIERALAQPALTDARWRSGLLGARAVIHERLGNTEADARCLREWAEFAEGIDDDGLRAQVEVARMMRADRRGRVDAAQSHAERALALAGATGRPSDAAPAATALGELAWLALNRDAYEEASQYVALGLAQARMAATVPRRQGGNEEIQDALHAIGVEALVLQERYGEALRALAEGFASLQGRRVTARARLNLMTRQTLVEMRLGRLWQAYEYARECVTLARDAGIVRLRVGSAVREAELAVQLGDLDRADELLREYEPIALQLDEGSLAPSVWEARGSWHETRGELEDACELRQRAGKAYEARGRHHAALHARASVAGTLVKLGRVDAAMALVEELLAECRADGRPQHRRLLAGALFECLRVLEAAGDARADEILQDLLARRAEQLAALPDEESRRTLLENVPEWRELEQMAAARAARRERGDGHGGL